MNIENQITALILAGGKSSRMGKDKALIKVGDKTFLEKTYFVAQDCATKVFIMTPWKEKYQSYLSPECGWIEENNHNEQNKFAGPLVAFAKAINQITTEWILLLSCDLPYLNAQQIQKWSQQLKYISPKIIAALPKNKYKGWECLCGFYRRSCQKSLQDYIENGGVSFQSWLVNCKVEELLIDNPSFLFNCNTPQDLKQIK